MHADIGVYLYIHTYKTSLPVRFPKMNISEVNKSKPIPELAQDVGDHPILRNTHPRHNINRMKNCGSRIVSIAAKYGYICTRADFGYCV